MNETEISNGDNWLKGTSLEKFEDQLQWNVLVGHFRPNLAEYIQCSCYLVRYSFSFPPACWPGKLQRHFFSLRLPRCGNGGRKRIGGQLFQIENPEPGHGKDMNHQRDSGQEPLSREKGITMGVKLPTANRKLNFQREVFAGIISGMHIACILVIMRFNKYHMRCIRLVFICLFCMGITWYVRSGSGLTAEGTPSVEETALFDLINQARKDPLKMAASLGLDPQKVLQDLPELQEILTKGLPALGFDRKLYEAAHAHVEEMFAENYYSSDSPDGRGYDDRIRETGYAPLSTGETLGFLAFNNFIEPGDAVQVIFEKMFKEELDPARTAPRNILNANMREAGIALMAGIFQASGTPWNAYIAVADFADSLDLYAVEKGLWRLVNEARRPPLQALEAAGIDEGEARESWGKMHGFWIRACRLLRGMKSSKPVLLLITLTWPRSSITTPILPMDPRRQRGLPPRDMRPYGQVRL